MGSEMCIRDSSMPRNQWPASWKSHNGGKGYTKPVVQLRLSLYGHPLAGLYWEHHCRDAVRKCGFEAVKGWECLHVNKKEKLFLSIYVDDFKMAGRKESLKPMWSRLQKVLELEEPKPLQSNVYLGCGQAPEPVDEKTIKSKWQLWHTLIEPDEAIEEMMTQDSDCEGKPIAGAKKGPYAKDVPNMGKNQGIKAYHYKMNGHALQCIEKYLELTGKELSQLRPVMTPCIDDSSIPPEEFEEKG